MARLALTAAVAGAGLGFFAGNPAPARASAVQAQDLRGRVIDGSNAGPVSGATILVRNTPLRAVSGTDGSFAIAGLPDRDVVLTVSARGFRAAEVAVEGRRAEGVDELIVSLDRLLYEVPGVTVTASKVATRYSDIPVSVAVMNGEELRRRDALTLAEALPFSQGVTFNAGQIDIRGSTGIARGVGSRVLMLLDGHRMLSSASSAIDFAGLPVLDVDQIEIVKGPHSTLWGTNALGGVVNIITKRPPREPETIVRGFYGVYDTPSRLTFADGALNRRGLAVQHSRRLGQVGTTLYVGREESDGFRQNGAMKHWQTRLKAVFPAESSNPLEVFVNWSRRDEEQFFRWLSEDRSLEVDPAFLGDWTQTDDVIVGATANPVVTSDYRLQVRPHMYHSTSRNYYNENDDYYNSTRLGADVQLSIFPALGHLLTVGAEGARTVVTSNFLDPAPTVSDMAVFVQDELYLSRRIRASAGLRVDYRDVSVTGRNVVLNPKLGVVFRAKPWLSLRTSFGRGYRSPSIVEQFTSTTVAGIRVIPNLDLRGEAAWAREVGATMSIGDRLWFDTGLFWSNYTDLIEAAPAPGEFFTFQFRNVAAATVRGIDAGMEFGLMPDALNLGVTYLFLDTKDANTGRALAYRSRHNLTATVSVTGWEGVAGAVDVRHRSRVQEVLAYPLDDRQSVTLVDLRLSSRILGADIQAKVENLFQTSYVDVQERNPGQTRSVRLTVIPRF